MSKPLPRWTVCQIGAREHYALAEAFAETGRLDALITDLWVPPLSVLSKVLDLSGGAGASLKGRYTPHLGATKVLTPGRQRYVRATLDRLLPGRGRGWSAIEREDERLGRDFARLLRRAFSGDGAASRAVFAYSYAALNVLTEARERGAIAVLGQIDAGPADLCRIDAIAEYHGFARTEDRPSKGYWSRWRQECEVAERIIVNSAWSRDLLIAERIDAAKIAIVPLVAPATVPRVTEAKALARGQPLTLLFLGRVALRKGVIELLEAMKLVGKEDVVLNLVGPVEARLQDYVARQAGDKVRVFGSVPRPRVGAFYRDADVFLFPTHSDGFGLTQLEALAHGVPVIASRHCGNVVRDGVEGRILDDVRPEHIAEMIIWFSKNRDRIADMRHQAWRRCEDFSRRNIAHLMDRAVMDDAT